MSNKRIIITTVAGTLIVTTALSFFSLSNKKRINRESAYNNTIITDLNDLTDMIIKNTTIADVKQEEDVTIEETTTKIQEDVEQEDELKIQIFDRLNKILKSKNLSERVNNLVTEGFEGLYKNYDQAYIIYKSANIPTKVEFINMYLDALSNNVDDINIVDDISNPYYGVANRVIYLRNSENDDYLTGIVMHENGHAIDPSVFDGTIIETNKGLYLILYEGKDGLCQLGRSEKIEGKGMIEAFKKNDKSNSLTVYGHTSDGKYNMYNKINSMFLHIVGYKELCKMEDTFSTTPLMDTLKSKYGLDGKKFISYCTDICSKVNNNKLGEIREELEYIDNFFLNVLEKEADSLDNKEDTINLYNFYRYYKLSQQSRYSIYDEYGNIIDDKTEEYFNFKNIQDTLFNKCLEYGVMTYNTGDHNLDKLLFNKLLSAYKDDMLGIYNLPLTLIDSKYIISDDNDLLVLTPIGNYSIDLQNGKKSRCGTIDSTSAVSFDLSIDNEKKLINSYHN